MQCHKNCTEIKYFAIGLKTVACRVLCIFIGKNYLWPETWIGELKRPLGG